MKVLTRKKGLICFLSFHHTTKAEDILTDFVSYFVKQNIDFNKLFCVAADGAAAIVEIKKRFVKLLEGCVERKILIFYFIIN